MSLFSYMNRCLAISCIFAAALVIAPPAALAGESRGVREEPLWAGSGLARQWTHKLAS